MLFVRAPLTHSITLICYPDDKWNAYEDVQKTKSFFYLDSWEINQNCLYEDLSYCLKENDH
jgi:hypothetical protein